MSNIIKFSDTDKIPAHLKAFAPETTEDWGSGQVSGFPVLSIKGKVFHIIRGDEKELISRPDDPDEAATSVHLVILKTHKGVARTYYEDAYEEGSAEAPDCFSNDGIAPDPSAENPQAKKCATCPHSQWGSRVTENGKKGKACSELKRLAVAEPGNEDDPMLLRVPPTSLKNWDGYLRTLGKRGVTPPMVVTKVGFDASAAHQLLTFKPVGFLDEEGAQRVAEMQDNDVVEAIIGHGPAVPVAPTEEEEEPAPQERKRTSRRQVEEEEEEPAPRKSRRQVEEEEEPPRRRRQAAQEEPEEEEEPAPRRRRRRVVEDDDEPAPRKSRRQVADDDDEPAPRKSRRQAEEPEDEEDEKPAKKSATVVEADDDLEAELDDMLGDLDFDDA